MRWNTIIMWIRLAAAIIVFVASCVSLGYLVEFWVRRCGWPRWVNGLMPFAIAFLWPETDTERARHSLTQTMYAARKALAARLRKEDHHDCANALALATRGANPRSARISTRKIGGSLARIATILK